MPQASFDLTDISIESWRKIKELYDLSDAVDEEDGWAWKGANGFVVTACDPITGIRHKRWVGDYGIRPNYAAYIGIEGDAGFVRGIFRAIKKHADFIKGEDRKGRSFL